MQILLPITVRQWKPRIALVEGLHVSFVSPDLYVARELVKAGAAAVMPLIFYRKQPGLESQRIYQSFD